MTRGNRHRERPFVFMLGGHDLEMLTIAGLVRRTLGQQGLRDRGLSWGARVSAYASDIAQCRRRGQVPVLVELTPDRPGLLAGCVIVDHHGELAGRPSALRQVFDLLGLSPDRWTSWLDLVAINDVAHIQGMRQAGAGAAVIDSIRRADRRAQGVTIVEEQQGRMAADQAQWLAQDGLVQNGLVLIDLPHDRLSTAVDPILTACNGPQPDILVSGRGEFGFFGKGRRVLALAAAFPGGWYGGKLPATGFWGIRKATPAAPDTRQQLTDFLSRI